MVAKVEVTGAAVLPESDFLAINFHSTAMMDANRNDWHCPDSTTIVSWQGRSDFAPIEVLISDRRVYGPQPTCYKHQHNCDWAD